jgi:hypothetical protein
MAFTINDPKFIDDGFGGFVGWTVGTNGAFVPTDLPPDNHGATGTWLSAGTGTDNQIYQDGVFPDFGTGVSHRIQIVVNTYVGAMAALQVKFGTTVVGTISSDGTFTFTGIPAGSDRLSIEVLGSSFVSVELDQVIAADIISVGHPQKFQPAYNPSVWYFDSLRKNEPGYRYFVEVLNPANVVIGSYRFVPAITTGYAVVDLTRILKNFVSFDDTTFEVQEVPNSWFGYYVKVYDEFSVPYVYDDYANPSGDLTSLQATTNTHNFIVGDQVTVAQNDGGVLKPMLQGVHSVIFPTVAGTSDLYIDVPFSTVGTGSPMGGGVIYSDNRKTISAVGFTSDFYYIFNGAVPFVDFISWNYIDYIMVTPSVKKKFLSSIPLEFYITPTQDIRLNFANWFSSTSSLYFENDGGDVFELSASSSVTSQAVISSSVGPLTTMTSIISGTYPLVKPNTTYYDVYVEVGGVQYSEVIRFYIDNRCIINPFEISFMDRMGSFGSFAFQLRDTVTNNNQKSTFKKLAGGLGVNGIGSSGYAYESTAKGEQVYNVNFDKVQQLTTNWMDDASSLYFQELVTSPVTYLKTEDGTYVAVVVTDSSSVEQRQIDKRLIKYTVNVRFANADNINI